MTNVTVNVNVDVQKTVAINVDTARKTYSITCRNVEGCSGWYVEGQQLKARHQDRRWEGVVLFQGAAAEAEDFKTVITLTYRAMGYTQVTIVDGVYTV